MSPFKDLPVEDSRFYASLRALRKEVNRFIEGEPSRILIIHGQGKFKRNSLRILIKNATWTYPKQIYSIIDLLLGQGYLSLNPSESEDTHVHNGTLYDIHISKLFQCYGAEKVAETLTDFAKRKSELIQRERIKVTQKQTTLI